MLPVQYIISVRVWMVSVYIQFVDFTHDYFNQIIIYLLFSMRQFFIVT